MGEQHVARLDVTMDQLRVVSGGQDVGQIEGHGRRVAGAEWSGLV